MIKSEEGRKIPITHNPCKEIYLKGREPRTHVFDEWDIMLRDKVIEKDFGGIPYEEIIDLLKEKYPERFI